MRFLPALAALLDRGTTDGPEEGEEEEEEEGVYHGAQRQGTMYVDCENHRIALVEAILGRCLGDGLRLALVINQTNRNKPQKKGSLIVLGTEGLRESQSLPPTVT